MLRHTPCNRISVNKYNKDDNILKSKALKWKDKQTVEGQN